MGKACGQAVENGVDIVASTLWKNEADACPKSGYVLRRIPWTFRFAIC
jgi:hypothetical protein